MTDTSLSTKSTPLIVIFRRLPNRAEQLSKRPQLSPGTLITWTGGVGSQLMKIYGKDSPVLEHFPRIPSKPPLKDIHGELVRRVAHVQRIVKSLEELPLVTKTEEEIRRVLEREGIV